MTTLRYDVLIIGAGLAGLTAALELPDHMRVALVAKRSATVGASSWAQGGIAAVLDPLDEFSAHAIDTMTAGANLCEMEAVQFVVENGPDAIHWLENLGVPFTKENEHLHLTREGGHSVRRIVHVADATGLATHETLLAAAIKKENIDFFEYHTAIDLITTQHLQSEGRVMQAYNVPVCYGAYVLDWKNEKVKTFQAQRTILAAGGAGKVYLYTTNPDTSTGDGIAMAARAGCRIANMEFMQFHPTCLYHPTERSFLISEALRGEGAYLCLPQRGDDGQYEVGERFMQHHDKRMELAPRDIVARAIDFEMKKHGLEFVYLDIRHKGAAFIQAHFPTIYQRCLALGIDITTMPIPVVPASHYTCGGVVTDLQGRTDIENLFAIGETAYTGLHGANRLASNSLLECIVFGRACAQYIEHKNQSDGASPYLAIPEWDDSLVTDPDEEVLITNNWEELRRFMWHYVGIVRSNKRLRRAQDRIDLLKAEIDEYYANFRVSNDLLELRNLVICADLIIQSALIRQESRGLHYSLNYPFTMHKAMPTVLLSRFRKVT